MFHNRAAGNRMNVRSACVEHSYYSRFGEVGMPERWVLTLEESASLMETFSPIKGHRRSGRLPAGSRPSRSGVLARLRHHAFLEDLTR